MTIMGPLGNAPSKHEASDLQSDGLSYSPRAQIISFTKNVEKLNVQSSLGERALTTYLSAHSASLTDAVSIREIRESNPFIFQP